jgi:hypothetical protein
MLKFNQAKLECPAYIKLLGEFADFRLERPYIFRKIGYEEIL